MGNLDGRGLFFVSTVCLVLALLGSPAIAQVSMEQVRQNALRATQVNPTQNIQESDYILGGQGASVLLNPSVPMPVYPNSNRAAATQIGSGNIANIDMTGAGNLALQTVIGSQNIVNQQQSGNRNSSTVTVIGDSNNVGSRQDGTGAAATISVRGDNNTISAQQSGNFGQPIGITQIGNGRSISVTRN